MRSVGLLVSQKKRVLTYVFLDQGSTHTFCDENLTKALKLSGLETSIQINTLSAKDELSRPSFYTSYAKDEITRPSGKFKFEDFSAV